jgi:hypothetical protein
VRHIRLLKKTHMPIALNIVEGCARPISRQRTKRVRLHSSIFARLASEILLSSLQPEFVNQDGQADRPNHSAVGAVSRG